MIRLAVLFAVLIGLAGCDDVNSWRRKLTVTVETPEGPVSASSVVEITTRQTRGPLVPIEGQGIRSTLEGETVVVPLPDGQYLFVLLRGMEGLIYSAFDGAVRRRSHDTFAQFVTRLKAHEALRIVPAEDYPMIVTFTDLTDPTSVVEVDPTNMAAHFGDGYALSEMVLEITREEVTKGVVVSLLSWWPQLRSGPYNSMTAIRLPNDSPRGWVNLGPSAFWSREIIEQFDYK